MCNILGENLVDLEKEEDKLELELENTKNKLRTSKNQINKLGTFSKRMTIKETERLGNELRTKWKMDIVHFITKIEFRNQVVMVKTGVKLKTVASSIEKCSCSREEK